MAVQQNRVTRSKKGMKNSHNKTFNIMLSKDKSSGEVHIRHHITKNNFYKGIKIKV